MEMLFTDFLCYRGPAMGQEQDVPDGEEGEHMWLGGQMKAVSNSLSLACSVFACLRPQLCLSATLLCCPLWLLNLTLR